MTVYVVALTELDLYLSPGEQVPDGSGAYVKQFPTKKEADVWLLEPERETYSTDEGECPLIITNTKGIVV
jgi:hypothetical protein